LREIQERIRGYELMAVFSPDVTEDELPGAIERVGGYIEGVGGTIVSTNQESPWGRRRLAYPIRHQGRDVRDGYYVLYYFDAQSTRIDEIEREIRLNDQLIRHILTLRGEIPAAPEQEGGEGEGEPAEGQEQPAATEGANAPAPEGANETEQTASEPPAAPEAPATPEPINQENETES
jgi:small subunit ribosomal protein S6